MTGILLRFAFAAWGLVWALTLWASWLTDEPWRTGATAGLIVAGAVCLFLGVRLNRALWFDAALAASIIGVFVVNPPLDGLAGFAALLIPAGVVVSAHSLLTLSVRARARTGPVLNHALPRILATVMGAVVLSALVALVLPVTSGLVSERWSQSLDVSSPQLLGGVALVFLGVGTGVTLLRMARSPEAPAGPKAPDEPTGQT